MSFTPYYTPTRKEYKCKSNISTSNKEKVRLSVLDKKNCEEKSVYIPKYHYFDITFLGKENYLVLSKGDKIEIFISPLIWTIVSNISSFINKDESLARQIKERIDSNSRLLIKKYTEPKGIKINNKIYHRVNTEIQRTEKVNIYAIHI